MRGMATRIGGSCGRGKRPRGWAIVLERLAKHACRIAGVDRTAIFVRDRRDPRVVIAAAGHGVSWDFAGSRLAADEDRKSTRLNSSHGYISYAVFCLKKKKKQRQQAKNKKKKKKKKK